MCVCVIFISYFKHEALALNPNSQMDLIESNILKLKFFVCGLCEFNKLSVLL